MKCLSFEWERKPGIEETNNRLLNCFKLARIGILFRLERNLIRFIDFLKFLVATFLCDK